MPDFDKDFVYKGQPIDAPYWRYSLRCRVEHETEKAYYWPQLSHIYESVAPVIDGWADVRMLTDQALQRRVGKKIETDGRFRITGELAPTGGLQKLTREKLERASTLYLSHNPHLIEMFETGRWNHTFFTPEHPKLVWFFLTEITGSRKRLRYDRSQMFRMAPHDFHLCIGGYQHQHNGKRADPLNQAIDIWMWQGLMHETKADALVQRIGKIAKAVQIWKAESGFHGDTFTDEDGYLRVRYSVEDEVEQAQDGCNRFGSRWIDLLQ